MAQDPKSVVIAKALRDPAFKTELLKNPVAAVEKAIGAKLPAGTAVSVLEDTATVVHLVLPPPSLPPGQLTDDELQGVSGGAGTVTLRFSCDSSNRQSCVPF